ncbi:14412_t:CDS:1, partial [Ambispora leptoticha]
NTCRNCLSIDASSSTSDFVTTNEDSAKRIPVWVENHVKQL